MTSPTPKPAILCLHGGGTNATIFNVQTIRLQRSLPQFKFIIPNGPFPCLPGPGVLPFFEGCGPFYRWISELGEAEMHPKTHDLIRRLEEEQIAKDGQGFVGVLGFSQGARLAAGLLLGEQVRRREGETEYGFGVFLNGTCPPLAYEMGEEERGQRIKRPVLVVVGKEDPWREDGRRLYGDHCVGETAKLFEFEVGHRLPTEGEDTERIAGEILRMFGELEGRGGGVEK